MPCKGKFDDCKREKERNQLSTQPIVVVTNCSHDQLFAAIITEHANKFLGQKSKTKHSLHPLEGWIGSGITGK